MNLRFSKKDIRLRITQKEAFELSSRQQLIESLPLPASSLDVRINLVDELNSAATFLQDNNQIQVFLKESRFKNLLEENSNGGDSIAVDLTPELRFIFEIDLFSRKKGANE